MAGDNRGEDKIQGRLGNGGEVESIHVEPSIVSCPSHKGAPGDGISECEAGERKGRRRQGGGGGGE